MFPRNLAGVRTGQRFGRLVVIEQAPTIAHRQRWRCQCDCGGTATVPNSDLVGGNTSSCQCLRREVASRGLTERNRARVMVAAPALVT